MLKGSSETVFFVLALIIALLFFEETFAKMKECQVSLPKTVGVWTRPDSPQRVDSKKIFDYMNGAGELYLGYRFNRLEVYEYTAEKEDSILVELYYMETSDDAFGLLSQDWGGEPLTLTQSPVHNEPGTIAPSARALYGAGLLRICSDQIYARVMAYRETPASREAAISLGRAIAANRMNPSEPRLLNILPHAVGSDWRLCSDTVVYFRSYLVLNSFYYLSHQNILDLDLSTEAVLANYKHMPDTEKRRPVRLLFVKYANQEDAREALHHFQEAYVPERAVSTTEDSNFSEIEDGWLGYRLIGRCIALVFESPDQESARVIINQVSFFEKGE